jgi:glycosyltransferase involved in cell wall biosynthesis
LTAEDVDIVLATGMPFAAFKLAKRLSDRLGRPYILDYRDPWTGNPHRTGPARPSTIREEAKLLDGCAAVTIVARSWALDMDRRFGLGPKVHVVTNGYDPEELASVRPYDFGHFAIVYTGSFYPPKRVISPVMAALKCLKETPKDKTGEWYFHYYGEHEDHAREEAKRFGVMEQVILHGRVPRNEALSAVRGAGVAVVISSVVEEVAIEDKGIVPAKVFEALGMGTPILLVAPPGSDIEAIIEATGVGGRCAGSDIDSIVSFLVDAMHCQVPESKDREVYAWTNIVKKLDAILRTVIGRI